MHSRMEIFKNAGFSFTCGRTKTEVLENDDIMHHILLAWRMLGKGCYRIYIVLAFSCGRANTIRIRYILWCVLSLKREKKYLDTCGRKGPYLLIATFFEQILETRYCSPGVPWRIILACNSSKLYIRQQGFAKMVSLWPSVREIPRSTARLGRL